MRSRTAWRCGALAAGTQSSSTKWTKTVRASSPSRATRSSSVSSPNWSQAGHTAAECRSPNTYGSKSSAMVGLHRCNGSSRRGLEAEARRQCWDGELSSRLRRRAAPKHPGSCGVPEVTLPDEVPRADRAIASPHLTVPPAPARRRRGTRKLLRSPRPPRKAASANLYGQRGSRPHACAIEQWRRCREGHANGPWRQGLQCRVLHSPQAEESVRESLQH